MENRQVQELIEALEYGGKVHIAVWELDCSKNTLVEFQHRIHSARICEEMKKQGLRKCLKCKALALNKAIERKEDFGGTCINGIYEYCVPVIKGERPICVVFAGSNSLKVSEDDKENCRRTAFCVARQIETVLESIKSSSGAQKLNPAVEMLKKYVNRYYQNDLKLSYIAKMYYYNEKYLGRLFKEQVGISFSEYILKVRVNKAALKLLETEDAVMKIAIEVGFNNVSYFNRAFRRYFHETPTNYRLKCL